MPSAPAGSQVESALHWSPVPEQSTAAPPVQEPDWQVSPMLQACPSSQARPSLMNAPAVSQLPSAPAGSQVLLALHSAPVADYSTALPAVQEIDWQVSPILQARPSSQASPSLMNAPAVSQLPSAPAGSQVLSALHWSPVPEQSTAAPPVQEPDWQVSPMLQAWPSSQARPSLMKAPAVSQLPSLLAGAQVATALHSSPLPDQPPV